MDAIDKLKNGYRAFRDGHFEERKTLYRELVEEGQRPKVAMIACADSRVSPGVMLASDPGEIFVIRNVANLVPPYQPDGSYHGTSAGLEYAVQHLKVEHIVVMGHAHCGGIRALFEDIKKGDDGCYFILPWIDIARAAHRQILETHPNDTVEQQAAACEKAAILGSLENLKTFPCIRDAVGEGTVQLHGWHIDIKEGLLTAYDEKTHKFAAVE